MNRPLTEVRIAAALGQACARWRDRSFVPRRESVAAIATVWGWSEALLGESIDALIEPFTSVALENFASRLPRRNDVIGLIMPGNIPGAGIHEIAIGLIAGCAMMVKTATAEPIFFERFVQTLREADADVGARIAVVNFSRERIDLTATLRASCDWIAAFGDDETIAQLADSDGRAAVNESARTASNAGIQESAPVVSSESLGAGGSGALDATVAPLPSKRRSGEPVEMGAGRLTVGFGSRVSGILVAAEMASGMAAPAVAAAIARDVSLFEQQGCLSPHHIFVEAPTGGAAIEFTGVLAAALERCAERMPPPNRYGLEEAAAVRRVREAARWRAIGGDTVMLRESDGLGWTVIWDEAAVFTPSPGYRTVTVSPIRDVEDLRRRLQPLAGRIEAFAISAPATRGERLHAELESLGVCYLCEPGAMQSPPIDWSHGGGSFIRALASAP
jgi:hypothetical protein